MAPERDDQSKPPANPHDTDPAVADTHASDPGATPPSPSPTSAPTTARAPRSVRAGDVLGRYELGEEIGEGGMASVFKARDRELRRDVAVKVLFPHLARRAEIVRRFHREARAAAGLEHPNILRIYDVGGGQPSETSPGELDPPYIVMELIRGRTLLEEIEQRGPILAEIAACIGALLADALAAAHTALIVHRDIKPSNVLIEIARPPQAGVAPLRLAHPPQAGGAPLRPGGRLLLADFGVARLETENSLITRTGALLGTPAYMSPEQATGDIATAKSDLYSLGATLYQLATGALPYSGSPAKVMSQIAAGTLVSPVRRRAAVGPELSRVIERLMATEPDARPATATEVATELRELAQQAGFGDPAEELAAYFADPGEFVRVKTPAIVAALLITAERAIAADRLPRAMALADRASALAPDDPAVHALIEQVTEGGRSSRRRRVLALAGAATLLAGGATALGVTLLGDPGPGAGDAGLVAIVADAGADGAPSVLDAGPTAITDAVVVELAVDAALAAPRDASPRVRDVVLLRRDAGVPALAVIADAAMPEAASAPVDAALAPGTLVVLNDTWCELAIDGVSHGRLMQRKQLAIAAGRHIVRCQQPGITGHRWEQAVEVVPGETATVRGSMLALVEVTIAVDDVTIDGIGYSRGVTARLKPGRYQVAAGSRSGWLDIPRVARCRVRQDAGKLVCDP